MTELKRIVLAEDNPNDVELTLAALGEIHLANEVVVVRDGAETLDYLFRRNSYAERPAGNPAVLLLDLKMPKVDGLEVLRALKAATGGAATLGTGCRSSGKRSPRAAKILGSASLSPATVSRTGTATGSFLNQCSKAAGSTPGNRSGIIR